MILKAIAGKLESWEAARIIGVTERTVRREKYFDFNVQHLHEILLNEHGLKYRYTWAKKAFRMRALVERRKKPGSHRKRRPRRPLPGMTLHTDASQHRWFKDGRYFNHLPQPCDNTARAFDLYHLRVADPARRVVHDLQQLIARCVLLVVKRQGWTFLRDAETRRAH
ncbi:MAG: hypothetical protein SGI92_22560 [Bryobacteraceae bacterium]|nr:hypothetical protein [Bryobacteraceae bacterium]